MPVTLSVETAKAYSRPFQLKLQQEDDGIILQAFNPDGSHEYNLLKLKGDGTVYLFDYIQKNSGFKVTKEGKLVVSKFEYAED